MAFRSILSQLVESVNVGILGLNRSCWGASTSGSLQQSTWLGFRLLRTCTQRNGIYSVQLLSELAMHLPQPGTAISAGRSSLAAVGDALVLVRGYKSNKRSLKPLNTSASWQAIQPLVEEQQQRKEVLGGTLRPRSTRRHILGPIVDTCLPPIPKVPIPDEFKRVGVITGQYSLKPERVFAIVQLAGTQYKVTSDDIIFVNQLPGVMVNDVLALDRVMLLGSRAETIVGRPYVPEATVLAAVEEHFRDGKVHVFKKKRRKRYSKYQAPRTNLTTLRILQIRGILPAPGDELAMGPELPIETQRPQYAALLAPGQQISAAEEEEQEDEAEEVQVGQLR